MLSVVNVLLTAGVVDADVSGCPPANTGRHMMNNAASTFKKKNVFFIPLPPYIVCGLKNLNLN
jgi:hypothetical protein